MYVAHHSKCTIFFFNDTAPTEIYTLSLHDALPISYLEEHVDEELGHDETLLGDLALLGLDRETVRGDRKSTRLNSSHMSISYAVFCLKKKMSSQSSNSLFKSYIS